MTQSFLFQPHSRSGPTRGGVFDREGLFRDALLGRAALHEVCSRGEPTYSGRATVPVLFDTMQGRIVSNESADIVRMLGSAFAALVPAAVDTYPHQLRPEIDAWNERIHRDLNNGVYRAGFAMTQAAYDEAVTRVFAAVRAISRFSREWHHPVRPQIVLLECFRLLSPDRPRPFPEWFCGWFWPEKIPTGWMSEPFAKSTPFAHSRPRSASSPSLPPAPR